jgi:L-proline amide hydrolase
MPDVADEREGVTTRARVNRREGTLDIGRHRIWYRIVGTPRDDRIPLLVLHGGPGAPHDYLESLEVLADERQVVLYDQLGCGESDHPDDVEWTVQHFVDELASVRRILSLDRVHLLGQSWGGMLALEYLLTRPSGIASLTLASSLASIELWTTEAMRLRSELPDGLGDLLARLEASGSTSEDAYLDAAMAYYERHVCRLVPFPEPVARAFEKLEADPRVYYSMWGASEFQPSGTLVGWDVTDRLGEIDVPTLVTSGRFDESTPAVSGALHEGIAGSRWVVFEESAHMAHVEEAERFAVVLRGFLSQHDDAR